MRDTPLRTLSFLCALSLLQQERGQAQQQGLPGWRMVAGGGALEFKGDKKWSFGPALAIRRMLSHRVSLDLDAFAPLTNTGPDKFTGVFGNFGPSVVWRGERHDFAVSAGVSAGTL